MSHPSVTFFQVGNGNFTLIQVGDANIVVDINGTKEEESEEGKTPLGMLQPLLPEEDGALQLDVLCITHGDVDHCGGFAEFQEEMDEGRLIIGEIWHPNYDRTLVTEEEDLPEDYLKLHEEVMRRREAEGGEYGDVEVALTARNTEEDAFVAVEKPDSFFMKVLSPYIKDEGDIDWDVNDVSLVLNLEIKGLSILFPGDSSAKTWQERIIPYTLRKDEMGDWAEADFLIASHHGSYSFFGEDRDEVREADPHPDNYEALDYVEPDCLIVLSEKRFPITRDESGKKPPHYAAYKWYHKWFRDNRGVSEEDTHPEQFKYTADGHIRLEYGDDGWEWVGDWSPDDDGGGNGGGGGDDGGKGFRYRPGPTRRREDEYA